MLTLNQAKERLAIVSSKLNDMTVSTYELKELQVEWYELERLITKLERSTLAKWKKLWADPEWAEKKREHHSQVMKDLWNTQWSHKRKDDTEEEEVKQPVVKQPKEPKLSKREWRDMVDADGWLVKVNKKEIADRLEEGWLFDCDTICLWSSDLGVYRRISLLEERIEACEEIKDMLKRGWTIGK